MNAYLASVIENVKSKYANEPRELRARWDAAGDEAERDMITRAVRFGLAALDHRLEAVQLFCTKRGPL